MYLFACGTFQTVVIIFEYKKKRTITKQECRVIKRVAIAVALIFLVSCTVVYLRETKDSHINIDEQQGLMPLDAELKVDTQMNDTKTPTTKTEKE